MESGKNRLRANNPTVPFKRLNYVDFARLHVLTLQQNRSSFLLAMRRYFMKRWQWVLLIVELALFAIILILPQVDLPDFTFHGGTAPTAMKARISPVHRIAIVIAPSMGVLALDVRLHTDTLDNSAPST